MAAVIEDERAYWVVLSMATGIGPVRFQRLLEICGGARAAWQATDLELAAAGLERRSADSLKQLRQRTSPERVISQLLNLGIQVLTLLDDEYPARLREVADPPPVLFVRGHLLPLDTQAIALVGTRRATVYGRAVAERLHRAALDAGGRTVCVLGNGLDQVYPPENTGLASQIVAAGAGAIVSEFAPRVPPDAVNFPRRNRIISGLSVATVIVEAGERSGALITADFALEQGREVMAVPGPIFSPMSTGTNELLKQGATPVTSAQDILDALGPREAEAEPSAVARHVPQLGPQETCVYQALGREPQHIDELARALGIKTGELSATLAILEIGGLAHQVGSMLYTRA